MPAHYINWTSPIDDVCLRSEPGVVTELFCWTDLELLFIQAFMYRLGQRREQKMLSTYSKNGRRPASKIGYAIVRA